MDEKELLERGLQSGVPLSQMEGELDWQENVAAARRAAVLRESGGTALGRVLWQPLVFLFGWFFKRVMHAVSPHSWRNYRQ
jgi:hypothetical protein